MIFFGSTGGRNLPLERRHHIFENGTLSINKVIRKDAGLYACTATNRQGQSATQSGQLKVIGKPYFHEPPIIGYMLLYCVSQHLIDIVVLEKPNMSNNACMLTSF